MEDQRPKTDGVVSGSRLSRGGKVSAYAHGFRIFGGDALGEVFASQPHQDGPGRGHWHARRRAERRWRSPHRGGPALTGWLRGIFARHVRSTGVVPQTSVAGSDRVRSAHLVASRRRRPTSVPCLPMTRTPASTRSAPCSRSCRGGISRIPVKRRVMPVGGMVTNGSNHRHARLRATASRGRGPGSGDPR
jgi:hypothetical protein